MVTAGLPPGAVRCRSVRDPGATDARRRGEPDLVDHPGPFDSREQVQHLVLVLGLLPNHLVGADATFAVPPPLAGPDTKTIALPEGARHLESDQLRIQADPHVELGSDQSREPASVLAARRHHGVDAGDVGGAVGIDDNPVVAHHGLARLLPGAAPAGDRRPEGHGGRDHHPPHALPP